MASFQGGATVTCSKSKCPLALPRRPARRSTRTPFACFFLFSSPSRFFSVPPGKSGTPALFARTGRSSANGKTSTRSRRKRQFESAAGVFTWQRRQRPTFSGTRDKRCWLFLLPYSVSNAASAGRNCPTASPGGHTTTIIAAPPADMQQPHRRRPPLCFLFPISSFRLFTTRRFFFFFCFLRFGMPSSSSSRRKRVVFP